MPPDRVGQPTPSGPPSKGCRASEPTLQLPCFPFEWTEASGRQPAHASGAPWSTAPLPTATACTPGALQQLLTVSWFQSPCSSTSASRNRLLDERFAPRYTHTSGFGFGSKRTPPGMDLLRNISCMVGKPVRVRAQTQAPWEVYVYVQEFVPGVWPCSTAMDSTVSVGLLPSLCLVLESGSCGAGSPEGQGGVEWGRARTSWNPSAHTRAHKDTD